jgi:alkyl sulfatase BDS1-like metallo-beta-lactamase superfamily hydrolase
MHTIGFFALAWLFVTAGVATAEPPPGHASPKGKAPSAATRAKQEALRESLPFSDAQDFEEQKRGLLKIPDDKQIANDHGGVAWDMGEYEFLLEGKDFDSIHPSLQRQAILNMNYGLYEVVDGIYQVRGFDLSNISFIRGVTGWIVFDPLVSRETARAALELVNDTLGARPVVAVVYSHSHIDHFGGVRGVVDEADVRSGKVQIIAPLGFMENAISENVYAGNAMIRRSHYQYGWILPRGPHGHVDQSIGKSTSAGTPGLIAPTRVIAEPIEELTVDGVTMVFQNTPGTEAPAEMNTWFPQLKAFWAAENITGTIHNIYTLRGAKVRDALAWSKYISRALYLFGQDAEVMFASHTWPRWGNERIQEVMRGQRDAYAHLNNHVLHLANQGITINEMHNHYEMPAELALQWYARGYHGSYEHNSRAVVNRYLGYWDANPATLTPLDPADSAPLYVELMGGAGRILERSRALFAEGRYRLAQEVLNKLVYAEPGNQAAKDLLADCFEQLGYQYESPSLRNSFLAAAKELREGAEPPAAVETASPDVLSAMTTEMFLEYLGILVDGRKLAGVNLVMNLVTPDNGEKFVVEVSNSALTVVEGFQAAEPDLTLTVDRADFEQVITGQATFTSQIESGVMKAEGDASAISKIQAAMVRFDPLFEIMPGTKAPEEG